MHDEKPRRVRFFSDEEVRADAEKYVQFAVEMGLSDAKVVAAEKVYVDFRVRMKCTIPKCPAYGGCAHCPPHSPDTDSVQRLVSGFRYGLLVRLDVDPSVMIGKENLVMDEEGKIVPTKALKTLLAEYRKLSDVVTRIEARAFYDGHYLAVSFAAGSCRSHYCNFQECNVLRGLPCRFPLRARPSMEGSSMNAYRMAAEAGWEVYPIGADCNPCNVPKGVLLGLVLVD